MPHLTLTDNNFYNPPKLLDVAKETDSAIQTYEDLQLVANKSLKDLCKNQSLLVFPQCLGEHDDGIEEQFIVQLEDSAKFNDEDKIVSCDDVKIKTGNLMGFIGFSGKGNHDTRLEIRSRFTENDGQDYFLHYMLEKVFKINLFEMNYSYGINKGLDFAYFLFPFFLNRALRQGIYREYKTFEKNDANVKGPLDINRHIGQNIPFAGRVAYRCREYIFDNNLTQLVRHTVEFIKAKEFGKVLLSKDKEIKNAVGQIIEVTSESYKLKQRQNVISKNLRPINHPYYMEYKNLQKICLMILRQGTIQFSNSQNEIYGILFDGAWLWEEYLATILCDSALSDNKFQHPTNKNHKGGIRLFDNSNSGEEDFSKCYRRIYPDFYRENSKGKSENGMILDAKYKQLEKGLCRDDLYQIISYMHTMKIETGGFIYPLKNLKDVCDNKYKLAGFGGAVSAFGFLIPNAKSYKDFKSQMQTVEEKVMKYACLSY